MEIAIIATYLRRCYTKWLFSVYGTMILFSLIFLHESILASNTFSNVSTSSLRFSQVVNSLETNFSYNHEDASMLSNAVEATNANLSGIILRTVKISNTSQKTINTVISGPITNTVLMGQFNYDTPFDSIERWLQIWSRFFLNIVVAGPFSRENQRRLEGAGIKYRIGRNDEGFVSPYENLLDTMQQYQQNQQNKSSIVDGILYMHDDGLLNVIRLLYGRKTLPSDKFISADYTRHHGPKKHMAYAIHVEREQRRWPNGTEFSSVSPIYHFEHTPDDASLNRTMHKSVVGLMHVMPEWPNLQLCLRQQVKMLSKYDETWWEEFADYSKATTAVASSSNVSITDQMIKGHNDAKRTSELLSRTSYRFSFPGYAQSDFLYAPLQYTDLLERATRPHIESSVFLECAIPTILQWVIKSASRLKEKFGGNQTTSFPSPVPTIQKVPLCTDFSESRGTQEMLFNCLRVSSDWGFYHPFKLRTMGAKKYSQWVDMVQRKSVT